MAASSNVTSLISPWMCSTCGGRPSPFERDRVRTAYSRSRSLSTRWRPKKPDAPVTRMVMGLLPACTHRFLSGMHERMRIFEDQSRIIREIAAGGQRAPYEDTHALPAVPLVKLADLIWIEIRGGHLVVFGLKTAFEETHFDNSLIDGRSGNWDQDLKKGRDAVATIPVQCESNRCFHLVQGLTWEANDIEGVQAKAKFMTPTDHLLNTVQVELLFNDLVQDPGNSGFDGDGQKFAARFLSFSDALTRPGVTPHSVRCVPPDRGTNRRYDLDDLVISLRQVREIVIFEMDEVDTVFGYEMVDMVTDGVDGVRTIFVPHGRMDRAEGTNVRTAATGFHGDGAFSPFTVARGKTPSSQIEISLQIDQVICRQG